MASTLPRWPVFEAISGHSPTSLAIVDGGSGQSYSYGRLLRDVAAAKARLSAAGAHLSRPLEGQRVAFLAENGYSYVVTFLAILAHDAVALPLSSSYPPTELAYILENSQAGLLLSTSALKRRADECLSSGPSKPAVSVIDVQEDESGADAPTMVEAPTGKGGLMLYTSGTTSRPKGVLLNTDIMTAQSRSLMAAWRYTAQDYLLHVLPLHHIHGIMNALFTPLMAGSAVEFLFPFNADATWRRFAGPFLPAATSARPVTVFTAVPTIYHRLVSTYSSLDGDVQKAAAKAISRAHLRLNMSGSAALPAPTRTAWSNLSQGNVLLERYGMSEVGMALSCGLDPATRVDGSVGWPLPSVEARLVDVETNEVIGEDEEVDQDGRPRQGEIQLRGPTVFTQYWQDPEATSAEFVPDTGGNSGGRWFKTGDMAIRRLVDVGTPAGSGSGQSQGSGHPDDTSEPWIRGPMYFIQGRKSVDIIKSGGEKVSALEVERALLSLPDIAEAAVIGIPSDRWGQKLTAVVVVVVVVDPSASTHSQDLKSSRPTTTAFGVRKALRTRLASHKIPRSLHIVPALPRNAMGKVNKRKLITDIIRQSEQ